MRLRFGVAAALRVLAVLSIMMGLLLQSVAASQPPSGDMRIAAQNGTYACRTEHASTLSLLDKNDDGITSNDEIRDYASTLPEGEQRTKLEDTVQQVEDRGYDGIQYRDCGTATATETATATATETQTATATETTTATATATETTTANETQTATETETATATETAMETETATETQTVTETATETTTATATATETTTETATATETETTTETPTATETAEPPLDFSNLLVQLIVQGIIRIISQIVGASAA